MSDFFVEWLDASTFVVYDAEKVEIFRSTAPDALALLRALHVYGAIGLCEDAKAADDAIAALAAGLTSES